MNSALNALIIGFGFMGEAHYNNLAILEREVKIRIAGVIDIDPSKLANKKLQSAAIECFKSVQEAYEKERYFDIVVVVTNTVSHEEVIEELFDRAVNKKTPPALFVEKPLVENTAQAIKTVQNLETIGYGTTLPFTCGYLFRESPALDFAIKYIQEQGLKIQNVRTVAEIARYQAPLRWRSYR